jgi:hypothetical protein
MLKFLLLVAAISFWNISAFAKRVYLNKEGLAPESVFSAAGYDYETCAASPRYCKPVVWPDRNSEIEDTGIREKVWRKNRYTNEDEEVEYSKVKVSYVRIDPKSGYLNSPDGVEGYIEAGLLSDKQLRNFYEPNVAAKYCPPKSAPKTTAGGTKLQEQIKPLEDFKDDQPMTTINSIAEKLSKEVGDCIDPSGKPKLEVTYDGYVYDNVMAKKLPNVVGEDGKKISRENLLDIDSLARTMYGEMARCYKYGLQYPIAVARSAVNRARAEKSKVRSEFINSKHRDKDYLAKVLTDKYQYSTWNKRHEDKKGNLIENPSLAQALCPPQDASKKYWNKKGFPSADEQEIWKNTMRIATEAVLFPKSFLKRSDDMKTYFYTSGMDRDDMRQVRAPVIEGHAADKPYCMKFWTDGKP